MALLQRWTLGHVRPQGAVSNLILGRFSELASLIDNFTTYVGHYQRHRALDRGRQFRGSRSRRCPGEARPRRLSEQEAEFQAANLSDPQRDQRREVNAKKGESA